MSLGKSVTLLVSGSVFGIVLVLSCSDDSPHKSDAATCDCPAAEPPLTGRFEIVNNTQVIAGNAGGGQSAVCSPGAQLLSGSCTTATINPLRDVALDQSGFYAMEQGWHCEFKNNEANPVTIKVSAICLKPMP